MTPVTVSRIETTEALQALQPEWEGLLRHAPGHALAVTPLWMLTWWEVFQEGRSLRVLAARSQDGNLVGLAPLVARTARHRGMLPFRRLEFVATGEPQEDLIASDYLDFVVHRDWEQPATRALCETIFGPLASEWDEVLLQHVPAASPCLPAVTEAARLAGLKCEEADRRSGVTVPLPATWEEQLARLAGDRRKQLLRRRRRLAEVGRVEFDWEVTEANFAGRWEVVRDLHQRRWTALGRPGCFASECFTRFHETVAHALVPARGIRMAVLRVDGRPLACDYTYVYDGRAYAYQAGLDPEEGLRLSAGTVGISYGIETAIREGLREYDFLKGVHPYKADWSKERREQVTLRVAQPTAREHLRTTLETGIRLVRPLRKRLAAARTGRKG